ncbi:MAG: polysaccharide biosynthesis C-terminal domain-containing protein [Bacteroidota bacterium]
MSKRSIAKDITGVLGSNVFAVLIGFLIDVVISRQLGPQGRGLYASVLVVPLLVVGFMMMGVRRSAVFHIGKQLYSDDRTVSGIMQVLLITSVLAMLLSGLSFLYFKPEGLSLPMVLLAVGSIPVRLVLSYAGGVYLGKEQFRRSNLLNWLPLFLNLGGVLVFVAVLHWSVTGALLALLLSNFLVALMSLRHIFSEYKISFRPDKEIMVSLVRLGVVYAFALLIMQLNYKIDILLLQKLSTLDQVGYYSLGVAISDKLWQLPTAMGVVVLSRTANMQDEALLNKSISSLLRVSFVLVLIAAVILWFVIPYLLPLIFGGKFIPSVDVVRAMLPGIVIFVLPRILNSRFAGIGQPKILVAIFVPALIVNVLLNLLWIPLYGGVGAAWASNVSYAIGAITLVIVYSVKMHVPLLDIFTFRRSDFDMVSNFVRKRILRKV